MKASLRKNTSKSIDLEDSGEDIKCREKSPASREDNLSSKRRHRAMIVVDDSDEDCIGTMQNKKGVKFPGRKLKELMPNQETYHKDQKKMPMLITIIPNR